MTASTINPNSPGPQSAGLSAQLRAQLQAAIADINALLALTGNSGNGTTANFVLAGPVSGAPGAATLRKLVAADEPARSAEFAIPLTGFAITPTPTSLKHIVTLDPGGTLATGTITMPPSPVADGQEVTVISTGTVTALTVAANAGQGIKAPPTMLPAGWPFTVRYRQSNATWYPA